MYSSVVSPNRVLPKEDWEHYSLYVSVREAVYSLPLYFKTETVISGIMATDIFTLSATLGATIEDQVVRTLNEMHHVWDPDDKYRLFGFVRQPQTFPDVLLKRLSSKGDEGDIVLGLELKGWYLLAKEGEPSFRFLATPLACAQQDIIVVVPWALSNVISGSPRVFQPFGESTRFAAEYRNYHWQHLRQTHQSREIRTPEGVKPYPRKSDQTADRAVVDPGGNFGRLARTGMMDDYIEAAKNQYLSGIEARHWLSFFKVFQEQVAGEAVQREMAKLTERIAKARPSDEATLSSVRTITAELVKLLGLVE